MKKQKLKINSECKLCGDECCKDKQVKVYLCPKCKSTNVGYVFQFGNLFGIFPKMRCSNCRYSAAVFPQVVIKQSKLNELNKKAGKKK